MTNEADKVTLEECIEMFGDHMPMEGAIILQSDLPVDEIRGKLRALATAAPDAGLVEREAIAKVINPNAFDEKYWMKGRMREQQYSLERADAILAILSTRAVAGEPDVAGAIERGEWSELPPLGDSRRAVAGEPVAWVYEVKVRDELWAQRYANTKPVGNGWQRNIRPLYTHPAPSGRDPATIEAERERCIAICESWIGTFQDKDIQYTSAREYAVGAIDDIIDLIRDGTDPSALAAPAVVTEDHSPLKKGL